MNLLLSNLLPSLPIKDKGPILKKYQSAAGTGILGVILSIAMSILAH
jgi:hypothetical protein